MASLYRFSLRAEFWASSRAEVAAERLRRTHAFAHGAFHGQ
jgi:hypothetical protein